MIILRIEHDDFILSVQANGLETTFQKARRKQKGIDTATHYLVSEGRLSIFDYNSRSLIPNPQAKTHPLFFENKDYFFNVAFRHKEEIEKPCIVSRIKEFDNKFFYLDESGLLAGTIN